MVLSLLEILVKVGFPFAGRIHAWLYPGEHSRASNRSFSSDHDYIVAAWRGAFQPLTHILKDIRVFSPRL